MMITRSPSAALRPFVKTLWVTRGAAANPGRAAREHVLPTGAMHLVFRLSGPPLRVFDDADDAVGRTLGHAVVGGPRATHYVRDVSQAADGIGAMFHPGTAHLLLGVPADALAGRHTRLEDLWGSAATSARQRLLEAGSPARQLDVFEALLAARLPAARTLHPAVAAALARLPAGDRVREIVRESGYSHRRFLELFSRDVGLTPKVYGRLLRFEAVLARLAAAPDARSAELALDAGYADQPHFNREFLAFTGVSPGRYRAISPASAHHLPVDEGDRGG